MYVETPCLQCGKIIRKARKRAWARWVDGKPVARKYCSKSCADRARVGQYIAANSPQWRGGRTSLQDIIRKSTQYERCRTRCFERDGYRSVLSGRMGRLIHHHITPYSTLFSQHGITKANWRKYSDVLFDLDNVATLQPDEHRAFHGRYGKVSTPEQFRNYLTMRIDQGASNGIAN